MDTAAANSNIAVLQDEVLVNEAKALWVFGYASLCWKPGFEFNKAVTGHVIGFNRKFWQGNVTHRGTEEKPGRVATLIEDRKGIVHGVAFAITGMAAIPYLEKRECKMGGYETKFTTFYPKHGEPFKVLIYIATAMNPHWLGDAAEEEIAYQVFTSKGSSGHNVEYVLRLAEFMRENFPKYHDDHLFAIEKELKKAIAKQNICFTKFMGSGEGCIKFVKQPSRSSSPSENVEQVERVEFFEHTTRIPEKKLRCLNL